MADTIYLGRGVRKLPKEIASKLINAERNTTRRPVWYKGKCYVPTGKWHKTNKKGRKFYVQNR